MEEHWKGQFKFAPDKVYDGDLALFERDYPEEEETEEEEDEVEDENEDN